MCQLPKLLPTTKKRYTTGQESRSTSKRVKGKDFQTFQTRMVISYWLPEKLETGEMAAPIAILLFVCTKPEQRRL